MSTRILVLYYSRKGRTAELARYIARGIESADGEAIIRTVPPVSSSVEAVDAPIPDSGPPFAAISDLETCDGLLLGSPTRFGNMAAPLKHFLELTSELWLKGTLVDKPAGLFTSTSSLHGGQETTLTSIHTTLLHHGMVIVGVPYSCPELSNMNEITGGTPYGATTLANADGSRTPSENELAIARFQGKHVAEIAFRLAG